MLESIKAADFRGFNDGPNFEKIKAAYSHGFWCPARRFFLRSLIVDHYSFLIVNNIAKWFFEDLDLDYVVITDNYVSPFGQNRASRMDDTPYRNSHLSIWRKAMPFPNVTFPWISQALQIIDGMFIFGTG